MSHRDAIVDGCSRVINELDAPRLATLDAIMQAPSGTPAERPGLIVSSP